MQDIYQGKEPSYHEQSKGVLRLCSTPLFWMVFLRADGMLFPIAFPFVPPAAHFSQQLEKWAKEPPETNGLWTPFTLKSFVCYGP